MNRKLKIGIVTDQLLAGGVQLAAIEQVKQLNKLGHKAKLLILMRKKYPIDFSYLVKDVPHEYLSDSYPKLFQTTFKFPIFSFLSTLHLMSPILAPRVLNVNDYDILISLGTTTCLTTQAIFRKLEIPYVAVIHDPIEYILKKAYYNTFLKYFFPILKPIARHLEHSFVKDASKTLIISQVHYNYIKNNYGITPQILGFGTKTLDTIPKQRGENILSFGRWQKEKNPEFLLKLIKTIPKTKLVIAGNWISHDELKEFRSKMKKYNLEKRVSVVPHYNDAELTILCAKARAFIHPHFEAFGLAALEAAGHGIPIIVPEKSGVTEMFKQGVHGFFPKDTDLKEYKKYAVILLANEKLAYTMGKAAYNLVKEKYSWNANIKSLLKIIYSILDARTKLRIAVLETGHSSQIYLAGGDKVLEAMVRHLPPKFSFNVIAPQIGIKHWQESRLNINSSILPRTIFDNKPAPFYVFITYCIRVWQSFWRLRSIEIDIVYSSTHVLPDVLPAYFLKLLKADIFWALKIHHLVPDPLHRSGNFFVNIVSYLMQKLTLLCMRYKCDMIFVNNTQLLEQLASLGVSKEKMRILGNGIEYAKIAQSPILRQTKQYRAIYLGRLHPAKGVFDTIPIWEKVVSKIPSATLAIIGEGQDEVKHILYQRIRSNNLAKQIHVLGFVPNDQLFSLLKKAKVFLFTDHEAGWSLAVAEAMACGLPVVGYKLPIFENVYKQGFITVEKYNTNLFAEKVILLLQNKKLWKRVSGEAKNQAELLSWEKTSKIFQTYLEEINYEYLPKN